MITKTETSILVNDHFAHILFAPFFRRQTFVRFRRYQSPILMSINLKRSFKKDHKDWNLMNSYI